jgi:signal transduction histidine kinase
MWSYRDDVWWAHVASGLALAIGFVGLLGASGAGAPAEVAAATVITVAGFEAKARWPRLPSLLVAVWTGAPAIVVNLQGRSEGTMFLLVVAASFVALTEPDRRSRLVVGVAGVLAPAFIAAFSSHTFGWPFWMMGIAFGWLSGEQMRRFRRLVDELEATRERLAAQAVHLERRRIAADLHDLVGHSLTVVLLYLTGARRQLQDDPAGAAGALHEAEEIGRSSLAEIRQNVAALRDSGDGGMAPTPGAGDLEGLVNRFAAAGSAVDLRVVGDVASLEAIVGVVVYRVVQESLNNAARHAPGATARVEVTVGSNAVDISVVDDGRMATASPGGGLGLIGMRERVEAIGGTLHAGPVDRTVAGSVGGQGASGWVVRAWVPRPAGVERRAGDRQS